MVWPFSQIRSKDSIVLLLVELLTESRKQTELLKNVGMIPRQQAKDVAAIRGLLWRLGVQPSEFEVISKGEHMGYMNKIINLGTVTEDVATQVVTIAAAGKVPIVKELTNESGQSVGFSVPQNTMVEISLQYFDDATPPNPSTVRTRTFVVVDDVAPEGPAELSDIVSVSETDEPMFETLADIVEPPPTPTGPTGPVEPVGPTGP